MKAKTKAWVVATVDNAGEYDMYADIIGVFSTLKSASKIAEMIRRGENPAGMDIANLVSFEKVVVLEMPMDDTIKNADN